MKKKTKKNFDGFRKFNYDTEIENDLIKHIKKYKISSIDALKLFPVLARRQWLKRFLAHAELFKKTIDIPGDIVELGVFRGLGLMTWANLLETYYLGDRTKKVYGFDNWSGFTKFSKEDGKNSDEVQKFIGGFSPKQYEEELKDAIKIFDKDRFVPWKQRIVLVKGNVEKTVKDFVKKNKGLRFSLVHFDVDLYKPTIEALKAFWPLLSKGGLMLFDEYAIKDFPGETIAVDRFFKDKKIKLKKLSWNNVPGAYVIK